MAGAYALAPSIALHRIAGGNHSFEPRKASGRTLGDNLDDAADAVARFPGGLGESGGAVTRARLHRLTGAPGAGLRPARRHAEGA